MIDVGGIDFPDLLDRIGLRNARMTSGGIEINYSCHRPEHSHNDESASAYINSESGLFMCHGCHLHGTVVDLVADVQQVSRATAERFLRDTYGIEFDEPRGGSMVAETDNRFRPVQILPEPTRPPESWLSNTRLDWHQPDAPYMDYMLARGLSPDTLTEFGIGYDYRSDRLTIPVRDVDGVLFGVKGRAYESWKQPKYLVLGDRMNAQEPQLIYGFGTYNVGDVIFGLDRVGRHGQDSVVLVEGELDVIALWQIGVLAVATGRAGMTQMQVRLLVSFCDEIVMFYDCGAAGEAGTRLAVEALEPHVHVKVAEPLDVDPMDACRDGREGEVLAAIESARSSLALHPILQ